MDDNTPNQQAPSTDNEQNAGSERQPGEPQNVENPQDQNPQHGNAWNNYRTREMGGNESEGDSRSSGESGSGGTLY